MTDPDPDPDPGPDLELRPERRRRSVGLASLLLWPMLVAVSLGFVGLGVFVERSVRAELINDADVQLESVAQREGLILPPERAGGADGNPGAGPGRTPADRAGPVGAAADAGPGEADDAANADEEGVVPVLGGFDDDGQVRVMGGGGDFPVDHPVLETVAGNGGYYTLDGDAPYRLLAVDQADGSTAFVALSTASLEDLLSGLRRSLLLGAIGVFAAEALVVWWVTRRVARPIGAMVDAADAIAHGALDTPIPTASRPTETARLGGAVTAMVDRLRFNLSAAESSAAEATAARAQMQRFLADASHELRTPLTAIGGYGQLHNRGMLSPDDLDQAMLRIERESARLSRLVDDMLQLARSGDEIDVVTEPVDLVAVAREVVADLSAVRPEGDLRVEADTAAAIVPGDPDRLHQALLNLVTNAVDHSPDDRPVIVRVTADAASTTVDVIDRGPGIEPADAERIFEPFYRPAVSRTRDGEGRRRLSGAGLGLALVRTIADRHGARVFHRPTPGGGATFSLAFAAPPDPVPTESVAEWHRGEGAGPDHPG